MPPRRNSRPPQDIESPVKLMFGLYQCLHHLAFLNDGGRSEKARPFARKVEELDRFFIPALPNWNATYKKRCHETNEKWRLEQIQNLDDHYQWCIEALKGSISAYNLGKEKTVQALSQAKKWARQQFKRKFKSHIFDKVDQMVQKFSFKEPTAKDPRSGTSSQIRSVEADKPVEAVKPVEAPAPAVTSTPKYGKRSQPRSPETSPTSTHTPKRSRTTSITYANKTKSPPARPNLFAKTQASAPAVKKFPNLKSDERGARIHSVWEIPKLTEVNAIFGDSNLARISFVKSRDMQIVSFPGLKLDLLLKLLQNFKYGAKSGNPGIQPSHVGFVVGLNDRGLSAATNEVNLKKVFKEAKRQFPNSKISFYAIPFDSRLKKEWIAGIEKLNDVAKTICAKEGFNFIEKIPRAAFATCRMDKSHIHWSEDCANATIEHIRSHLN